MRNARGAKPEAQPIVAPAPRPKRPYGTDTLSEMGIVPMCDETERQPVSEPTEAQIEAAADVVLAWESETFGKASARVFADAVLRAALGAKE